MGDRRGAAALMDYRVSQLEEAFKQVAETLKSMDRTLTSYAETKSALDRAFTKMTAIESDILAIKLALPVLKLTSSWVRMGVIGVVGLVGAIAVKIIFGGS